MDSVTLILTALGAGASTALQETAGNLIKDAYGGLKSLIQKKFQDDPKKQMVLEEHEKDPQTWKEPLAQAVRECEIDKDSEILEMAERIIKLLEAQKSDSGKYDVNITGDVQGMVQGDNAKVTMNFGEKSKKKK